MNNTHKIIHVKPGSELDRVLEEADETPIELEKNGVHYRVSRVDAPPTRKRPKPANQPRDSLLNIIGIGRSKEPTNIAEYEKGYLVETLESERRQ